MDGKSSKSPEPQRQQSYWSQPQNSYSNWSISPEPQRQQSYWSQPQNSYSNRYDRNYCPPPPEYYHYCRRVDDQSINKALRGYQLTREGRTLIRYAQHLAVGERQGAMENCELVMYLDNCTMYLRSGNGDNRIVFGLDHFGKVSWQFTKRSFTQNIYRAGRGALSFIGSLGTMLGNVLAIGADASMAIGFL